MFRLLIAVGAPVALLALAEGITRALTDFPAASFFVPAEQAIHPGPAGLVFDNPYAGYTVFPPALARAPGQNRFQAEKPPGGYRVVVLGESAAMGFPLPEFGLARALALRLTDARPGQTVEVMDGTMTMINSHVLRGIATEAIAFQPDAAVLYIGNNEAIGPHGPAGIFGRFHAWRWMTRLDLALGRWHLVRWLRERWQTSRGVVDGERHWRGLDHFSRAVLPADDPRVERMYAHYEANLREMVRGFHRVGVEVVLVLPPVNLDDWPPLKSVEAPLPEVQRQAFWAQREQAAQWATEGEWAAAEAAWQAALTIDPGHAQTWYDLAGVWQRQGLPSKAREAFEEACRLDGYRFRTDRRQVEILRELAAETGARLVDARSLLFDPPGTPVEPAPRFYEHVHLTVNSMIRVADQVARTLLPDQDPAAWPPLSEALLHTAHADVEAWQGTRTFLGMEVFRGQSGYRERMARLEARVMESQRLADQEDNGAIEERWNTLRSRYPEDWIREVLHGRWLLRHGRAGEAYPVLQGVAGVKPNWVELENLCGYAAMTLGDLDQAAVHFARAVDINPYHARVWNNIGLVRFRSGNPVEAIAAYRRALTLQPDLVEALNNLGYAHYSMREYAEARRWLDQALLVRPDMWEALYHRGLVALAAGDPERAIADFRQVVERQPTFLNGLTGIASAFLQHGDAERAAFWLENARELDPESPEIALNLAFVYLRRGQAAEAIALVRNLAVAPDARPDMQYVYGKALMESGEVADALVFLRRAVEAVPARADWMLDLAEAWWMHPGVDPMRRDQEVRALLRRVRDTNRFDTRRVEALEARLATPVFP